MTEPSETAINFTIDRHKDEVMVVIDKAVRWFAFSPEQARTIAAGLNKIANQIDPPKEPKA